MSLEIPTQQEFFEALKNYFLANQSVVTDLNRGSALYTQFQAMATQLNQAMVKASGGFKVQFEQMPYEVFDFERESATIASGTVIFSRSVADSTEVDIPSGTIVGTSGGLLYTTQAAGTILSGNTDSAAVNIIAEDSGSEYNVLVGIITILNSTVAGVNSVVNNTSTSGGTDEETNAEYFSRFTDYILGLAGSNSYGIITAAKSVETILSAYVEDHYPPESGIYNFTVYVDDGSGSVPSATLDEVDLVLRGNNTSDYQGYAAGGINFRVMSAGLISIAVTYTIEINTVETNSVDVESSVEDVITNYVNSLGTGDDVIRSRLIGLVQAVSGVITVTALTLNATSVDITVDSDQVARVSTITGTIS